jgi:hypothetical protein
LVNVSAAFRTTFSGRKKVTADNLDYFQKRAEAELELAQSAAHAEAVRAHYMMASHYLDIVHNEDRPETAADETHPKAGVDEWVLRYATKASQEHKEMAPDYVAARIEACQTAGDSAGRRMWEQVLRLVSPAPTARVNGA